MVLRLSTSFAVAALLCRSGALARHPRLANFSGAGAPAGIAGTTGDKAAAKGRAAAQGRLAAPSDLSRARRLPGAARAAVATRGGGAAAGSHDLDVSESIKWPVFISFLYYVSIAMTAPALPAFCNQLFSEGGADVVNARGAELYGLCSSVDQAFTFLCVGFWGQLSDRAGRQPLAALSAAGVACGWLTVAFGHTTGLLLAGRALDGVTSCMLPITQSMVRDLSAPADLSANLGKLQGLAVGGAFITGAMAGGVLTQRQGPRFVFKCAAAVAAAATLLALTVLPETLPAKRRPKTAAAAAAAGSSSPTADYLAALDGAGGVPASEPGAPGVAASGEAATAPSFGNPLTALRLLGRSRTSLGATLTFLAFWAGLNGLQINLFNFAQHKFGWSKVAGVQLQAASGALLALSNGLGPALLKPRIGTRGTVRLGMLLMAGCLLAASHTNSPAVFRAAVLGCSLATVCLPVLLATVAGCYGPEEGGASLAALETANTLNRVAAYGGMSRVFGWSIREPQAARGVPAGFFFALGAGAVALGLAVFEATVVPAQRLAQRQAQAA